LDEPHETADPSSLPAGHKGNKARARRRFPWRRLCQALSFALFCYLLFYVAWPYAETFTATLLSDKEWIPAELFLWLDPLSGLSTAIAGRYLGISLLWTAGVLLVCVLVPRAFCSHVCPLGTITDLFHWLIGRRIRGLRIERRGAWVHTRYYLLAAVLAAGLFGVLLSGYVAAIPVVTRGFVFIFGPIQLALLKHSGMVPPVSWTYWVSVALFVVAIGLGVLGRRFWCRYVCPTGALLSLASPLRLRERKVTASCVRCGKCVGACPFDAINSDFTTRPMDCAFCPDCAAACPVDAVVFVPRRPSAEPQSADTPRLSRRAFIGSSAAGLAAAVGIAAESRRAAAKGSPLLRPPGSVREDRFLELCVRCGECIKACPGSVLHPAGLEAGIDALWTPVAVPSWAGCHQDCNFCGQVCPTGAIRPLAIEVKRKTHMGLAVVDREACLPHRGDRDCQLCYEECRAAGYHAIEMKEIQVAVGDVPEGALSAMEIEEAGRIPAPFVNPAACVGCGLCEYRCYAVWGKQNHILRKSAIVVTAQNADRPP